MNCNWEYPLFVLFSTKHAEHQRHQERTHLLGAAVDVYRRYQFFQFFFRVHSHFVASTIISPLSRGRCGSIVEPQKGKFFALLLFACCPFHPRYSQATSLFCFKGIIGRWNITSSIIELINQFPKFAGEKNRGPSISNPLSYSSVSVFTIGDQMLAGNWEKD